MPNTSTLVRATVENVDALVDLVQNLEVYVTTVILLSFCRSAHVCVCVCVCVCVRVCVCSKIPHNKSCHPLEGDINDYDMWVCECCCFFLQRTRSSSYPTSFALLRYGIEKKKKNLDPNQHNQRSPPIGMVSGQGFLSSILLNTY